MHALPPLPLPPQRPAQRQGIGRPSKWLFDGSEQALRGGGAGGGGEMGRKKGIQEIDSCCWYIFFLRVCVCVCVCVFACGNIVCGA